MKKVLTITGTRPQFIKSSIISKLFRQSNDIEEVLVNTGQHFDFNMSSIFFKELNIPFPKYNLNVHSMEDGAMIGRMLEKLDEVVKKEMPDLVLVYGDTNTTLAGALAAKKNNILLAHVEAGLRSYDMSMPEEINRIITDKISDILFCPTQNALSNIRNDDNKHHCNSKIIFSGDVMFDLILQHEAKSYCDIDEVNNYTNNAHFILCTIHRKENINRNNLSQIVSALNHINSSIKVLFPAHPRTYNSIREHDLKCKFKIIPPLGYLETLHLMSKCAMVITDSGGLQKEAYFLKKNCMTIRKSNEWIELNDTGNNILTNANQIEIIKNFEKMISKKFNDVGDFFGQGNAAQIIVNNIQNLLHDKSVVNKVPDIKNIVATLNR